jgi:hypothetical protein
MLGRQLRTRWLAGALALWAACSAGSALAQTSVVVLGIRSVEGDDDLANGLTEQLRGAARGVDGWSVSSAAVSMAQMSLAHGCDELDAACLTAIANSLQVRRVLYGTLQRTGTDAGFDYGLKLSLFDAESGTVERSVDDTIPQSQTGMDALADRAQHLLRRIASSSEGGSITVQANVPQADVRINGQAAGQTRDGTLRLAGLQAGSYRVEVVKPGYADHVSTVEVSDGADTALTAVLTQVQTGLEGSWSDREGSKTDLRWLGWTLVGVGAASAVGFLASAVVVSNVNDDPLYARYRDLVALHNEEKPNEKFRDVCDAAEAGLAYDYRNRTYISDKEYQEAVSLCRTGNTFEVLQYVFGAAALLTGAAGAVVLLTSDGGEEERAGTGPALAWRPLISADHAYVSATLRF